MECLKNININFINFSQNGAKNTTTEYQISLFYRKISILSWKNLTVKPAERPWRKRKQCKKMRRAGPLSQRGELNCSKAGLRTKRQHLFVWLHMPNFCRSPVINTHWTGWCSGSQPRLLFGMYSVWILAGIALPIHYYILSTGETGSLSNLGINQPTNSHKHQHNCYIRLCKQSIALFELIICNVRFVVVTVIKILMLSRDMLPVRLHSAITQETIYIFVRYCLLGIWHQAVW